MIEQQDHVVGESGGRWRWKERKKVAKREEKEREVGNEQHTRYVEVVEEDQQKRSGNLSEGQQYHLDRRRRLPPAASMMHSTTESLANSSSPTSWSIQYKT